MIDVLTDVLIVVTATAAVVLIVADTSVVVVEVVAIKKFINISFKMKYMIKKCTTISECIHNAS